MNEFQPSVALTGRYFEVAHLSPGGATLRPNATLIFASVNSKLKEIVGTESKVINKQKKEVPYHVYAFISSLLCSISPGTFQDFGREVACKIVEDTKL